MFTAARAGSPGTATSQLVLDDDEPRLRLRLRHAFEFGADPQAFEIGLVHAGAVALLAGRLDENAGGDEQFDRATASSAMVATLVCQIQSDLSPLCVPVGPPGGGTPAADEVQAKFAWSARAMLSLYTAAPLLKSGAPAAGAVFSTRISFKPGD